MQQRMELEYRNRVAAGFLAHLVVGCLTNAVDGGCPPPKGWEGMALHSAQLPQLLHIHKGAVPGIQ